MTAPDIHPFEDAITLTPTPGGALAGRTTAPFANMVGPFGGATAATLLHAVELQPDRLGDPLALTVNFAAPIADGDFTVETAAVRTNRSNQHWNIMQRQAGQVASTASAVFGLHRDTWADTEAQMPLAPPPEDVQRVQGVPVAWLQNYDMRFVDGPMPVPGSEPAESSTTTLWVRDSPARPLDFASLVALCDCFYPRPFLRLGGWLAAGTVSMTVHVHATIEELQAQGTEYVLATARASRFARGYADQSASLWGRDGTLLATTHQLVYFNDRRRP